MKSHRIAARALGLWLAIQSMTMPILMAHRWPLVLTAGGVVLVAIFYFLTLWTAIPILVSAASLGLAAYWPQNCATWWGWIGMLFRLIGALFISNLAWAVSAVLQ